MAAQRCKLIDLALQGGGSHGALTWGVLDRLLADERLKIASISGTSAGAVNAVVVAEGLDQNGREGARSALQSTKAPKHQGTIRPRTMRCRQQRAIGVGAIVGPYRRRVRLVAQCCCSPSGVRP